MKKDYSEFLENEELVNKWIETIVLIDENSDAFMPSNIRDVVVIRILRQLLELGVKIPQNPPNEDEELYDFICRIVEYYKSYYSWMSYFIYTDYFYELASTELNDTCSEIERSLLPFALDYFKDEELVKYVVDLKDTRDKIKKIRADCHDSIISYANQLYLNKIPINEEYANLLKYHPHELEDRAMLDLTVFGEAGVLLSYSIKKDKMESGRE